MHVVTAPAIIDSSAGQQPAFTATRSIPSALNVHIGLHSVRSHLQGALPVALRLPVKDVM